MREQKLAGLIAAVTTPVDSDLNCDLDSFSERCHYLLDNGCDGLALFGTTGEGPLFSTQQRMDALDHLYATGINPEQTVISVSAMTIDEIVFLSRHATDAGCAGILLMPPFFFREQITDRGAYQFYSMIIDKIARSDLKLILYHFPDITGVSITFDLARRIIEKYPGTVISIKDSSGDWDYTESLLTRYSNLSILTGTEFHVPRLLAAGGAGTICGLANVIPSLLRQMFDAPTLSERRKFIPIIHAFDTVMSRGPFICCLKAIIANQTSNLDWLRVIPPLSALPAYERSLIVRDFNSLATQYNLTDISR